MLFLGHLGNFKKVRVRAGSPAPSEQYNSLPVVTYNSYCAAVAQCKKNEFIENNSSRLREALGDYLNAALRFWHVTYVRFPQIFADL